MIGNKSKFISLKKHAVGTVRFGDNTTANIVGKGTLILDNWRAKNENMLYVEV